MKPGCAPFETELSAFVDGELDAATRAHVEHHVAACAHCRAEVVALRRVGTTLRRWDAHETRYATSTGFRNRVLALVDSAAAEPAGDLRAWRRASAAAAVAACAVAAVTWSAMRPAPAPATDLDALAARVQSLEAQVAAARDAAPRPVTTAGREPLDIERLGDVPEIVAPETASNPAAAGPEDSDPWEMRGGGMLLRDAIPDYEHFNAERLRLSFEERLARVEHLNSAGAGTDPGTAGSATTAAPAPSALGAFFANVDLVSAKTTPFERIQVWPIEVTPATKNSSKIVVLEQAIDERVLQVSEDNSGGVVAENSDLKGRSVLLLAGDVLKGGRRDRVLREDVLLAPGRRISLPVFGASAERSGTSYRRFTRSLLLAPVDVRAYVASAYLGAVVTQHDVDEVVRAAITDLGSPGGERSLENLWTNPNIYREGSRYVDAFRKRLDGKNVVGFVLAAGSDLIGVEVCGDPETFRALRDRLLRSHVLYALARPSDSGASPPSERDARALLTAARTGMFDEPPAAGDGTLSVFRAVQGDVFGYGLLDGTRVVHATVFAGVPSGGSADASTGRRGGGADAAGPVQPPRPTGREPGAAPDRTSGSGGGRGLDAR